jgi:hypothetical protein
MRSALELWKRISSLMVCYYVSKLSMIDIDILQNIKLQKNQFVPLRQ